MITHRVFFVPGGLLSLDLANGKMSGLRVRMDHEVRQGSLYEDQKVHLVFSI